MSRTDEDLKRMNKDFVDLLIERTVKLVNARSCFHYY